MIIVFSILAVIGILLSVILNNKFILFSVFLCILSLNAPNFQHYNWQSWLQVSFIILTMSGCSISAYLKNKRLNNTAGFSAS